MFMTVAAHCFSSCKTQFKVSMATEEAMLTPCFLSFFWLLPHNSIS